jgi:anti-sigma regulatory factor (Ser/Thr protein kinase)
MTIIDLGEVITKAVGNLSDYPGRDKVKIITPEEMYYPLIFGNANLIMRIVINLLTNAVKYINYDGKTEENIIRVYVENIGDRIGIQISDNGRGIPQKDIDHLFERFYRVDNSGSHDVGGSGIGLAIAKDVADMHDGTINVISNQGEGAGSTFTLVLPQAAGVFRSVYDDAVTGIVSEEQYYRNAADFMAIQAVEAIRSMGYDDAEEEAKAYENLKEGEKSSHDKVLASLFVKLGEERYTELVDELTYIEPDMDEEFDEDYAEDEGFEEEIIETLEEAPDEAEDETDDVYAEEEEIEEDDTPSEEEELRRQKEEARKLLTQPILPRANMLNTSAAEQVQVKPEISTNHENSREKVMIHPISDGKMYNSSGKKGSKKKNGLFDNLTKAAKEETEGEERQSAVRRVLDSIPLIPNAKHDDEGELN